MRAFLSQYKIEKERATTAALLATNWRQRGCFLHLDDALLFDVAALWVRSFAVAFQLDHVDAGRDARATEAADLAVQAVVSNGKSVLNLDGVPTWGVRRVANNGGDGAATGE